MPNRLIEDIEYDTERSIWRLNSQEVIPYSDGRQSEQYLAQVLESATDLSSLSPELQERIIDWPSEYHLSRKRAQLLRGFDFNKNSKVLAVGCGCGAVLRFLGETFDQVIGVEGSLERATIAGLRTRDQENVSILSAPFQSVKFKGQFDLALCIGVFEYSRMFVDDEDPYDSILQRLSNVLKPSGTLIMAIENQFGLRYFCSTSEDHSGVMFDGIEGYHQSPDSARTFGYTELTDRLAGYFPHIDVYFPYPDYKMPDYIISQDFLERVQGSELLAGFRSNDYYGRKKPLFDEGLALAEVARNRMLPFLANSFLVFAGKAPISVKRDWLAILYSDTRRPEFLTYTTVEDVDGRIMVRKNLMSGADSACVGKVNLNSSTNPWIDGPSLQLELIRTLRGGNRSLSDILRLTLPWFEQLRALSTEEDGVRWVDGKYADAIWRNTIIRDEGVSFIDLEWEWAEKVRLSHLIIRSVYHLYWDINSRDIPGDCLGYRQTRALIADLCRNYGLPISKEDFRHFLNTEADFCCTIQDSLSKRHTIVWGLQWWLWNSPSTTSPGRNIRRIIRFRPIRRIIGKLLRRLIRPRIR